MSGGRVRIASTILAASIFFAATGCGSNDPYAVDPPLREASNQFAGAVSRGDAKALAQLNGGRDEGRLAALLASYGGIGTHSLACNEGDRGTAHVQFTVKCRFGSRTIPQRFVYISGNGGPI